MSISPCDICGGESDAGAGFPLHNSGFIFRLGKPEGKRPLGKPKHRREDNIKMDLQQVGYGAWAIWLRIGTGGGHF